MNNLFTIQHPAWSVKAAARARLDGWTLYYAPVPLPPDGNGTVTDGQNQSAGPLVLPAIKFPLEF